MKESIYRVTSYRLSCRESRLGTTYGISRLEKGVEKEIISDISKDRALVESMVEIMNDARLDPVHFSDVVEDMKK